MTQANSKNSNGNDENVGGIDHGSNGSDGNRTKANKTRVNSKHMIKTKANGKNSSEVTWLLKIFYEAPYEAWLLTLGTTFGKI